MPQIGFRDHLAFFPVQGHR